MDRTEFEHVLSSARSMGEIMSSAYGYLSAALEGWMRGQVTDAELAQEYVQLMRECAPAIEAVMERQRLRLNGQVENGTYFTRQPLPWPLEDYLWTGMAADAALLDLERDIKS